MESRKNLLKELLEQGGNFTFENFSHVEIAGVGGDDTAEWLSWKTRVRNTVRRFMADNSPACEVVTDAMVIPTYRYSAANFERAKSNFIKALELTLSSVEDDSYGELRGQKTETDSPTLSNKVFVVHGHDQALKTDVERFLHEIGLEPIVLHRQPDQGRTIIEKFEAFSDVGYAFILLTPDDIAYTADQESKDDPDRKKEKRARQNVIFEFGFFVGKLGREGVCCLHKKGVVLPSDLDGLVYKAVSDSVDTQGLSIIRELRAAGYKVNFD